MTEFLTVVGLAAGVVAGLVSVVVIVWTLASWSIEHRDNP